jgi:competence ComEA-like helix-hairpin-helix protein
MGKKKNKKLPKLGFLYLDYVLRFFDKSNFKGWPGKIETVTYHWKNDKDRFIKEVKKKKIDVLVGNIPATAYETFREIARELPHVRFIPSIETQFSNKSKENVTLFCKKHDIAIPHTEIFYNEEKGDAYLKKAKYPQIVKRSYGPSNYGGYYVHKVDNYKEARELFDKKKYKPIYTQDAIDLKYSGDVRVMLIGHKPICAFWRFSGEGEWITNTSQGGTMSYEGVSMDILELAVKASKAAKAEYWACDIAVDAKTNKPYILECATAFAAFPYVRDWIGQYIMWDLSNGRFKAPHIPLYSWEELGKIDASLLRTMRHIGFSKYKPSCDGAWYVNDKDGKFDMEKAELSVPSDMPDPIIDDSITEVEDLPKAVQKDSEKSDAICASEAPVEIKRLKDLTLTDLLALHGMDEEMAEEILSFIKKEKVKRADELLELEFVDEQILSVWKKTLEVKVDINRADVDTLMMLKPLNERLANAMVAHREDKGNFKSIESIVEVKGIGKKKLEQLSDYIKV